MNENIIDGIEGNDSADTLGGRIMSAREALGYSTARLARYVGVKTATMQGWESDRSEPRANKLVMLSGVLNVSPSWLMIGEGEAPTQTEQAAPLVVSDEVKQELSLLRDQARDMTERFDALLARI